jgi:sugar (pentulose or hexulose) kinase
MEVIVGLDLGTTKSSAVAVNCDDGSVVAKSFVESEGRDAIPAVPGRSEWNAVTVVNCGIECLRQLARELGADRAADVMAIGVTGQQHGMVVVDERRNPLTPFINWQDQRGNESSTSTGTDGEICSWVELARERLGSEAIRTIGCQMNTGFLATTLFWLAQNDQLPSNGVACFIGDLLVAELTNTRPVIEPTNAGGSGLFDVARRSWSDEMVGRLDLPTYLFGDIQEANLMAGTLTAELAETLNLPSGIPVFPSIGDHQASFVGSVADRHSSILVNVGTGAQVAVFTDRLSFEPPIELRPFPISGNLLSNVGLAGGWSYQVLETFIRQIGRDVFGLDGNERVFDRITQLATESPAGSDGLEFTPTFSGTRSDPRQRGSLTGISPENFSTGNVTRSVIEGMARGFRMAYEQIQQVDNKQPTTLVGAGNGLRENGLLSKSVELEFGLCPRVTKHREEAAYGAALVAGVGCQRFVDLDEAGGLIEYE